MSLRKELRGLIQRIHQNVDFGPRIVEAKGCTACGGHAEAFQERLGTMRSRPYRHAGAGRSPSTRHGAWMPSSSKEKIPPLPGAVPITRSELTDDRALMRIGGKISLMGRDRRPPDRVHVIQRIAKADRLDDRRRTSLEPGAVARYT